MRGFRYKFGDRPLDGFTIQRGIGRGGFGEVYYALSDSGKEVALKVIQGFEQVELRGVGHCMNLKSQHLVTIFDVKHGEDGTPFVIMEYVAGPTLRQLLDESPGGLGAQKTAYFLREIGKGLSVLHECGIVHRDLKPGNIFFENGVVKIGDYGLSKAMTASQHSGQTITVGTVHYMAPEIGAGKYDQGIDIYALGAVIYELLTGTVPFLGSSPTEILMKHLSAEPDVSRLEEPFASVIKRCMAKDPTKRFASVQEVVEAVFGTEHVRQSVSVFSPESLSMVAQRAADRIAAGGGSASPVPRSAVAVAEAHDVWGRIGQQFDRAGVRLTNLGDRLAGTFDQPVSGSDALLQPDPLGLHHRLILSAIVLTLLTIAAGVISTENSGPLRAWANLLWTIGATAGLMVMRRKLMPLLSKESLPLRRLACGGAAMAGLLAIGFMVFADVRDHEAESLGMTLLAIMLPMFIVNWPALANPLRAERLTFRPVAFAGAVGGALSIPLGGYPALGASVAAGTAMLVQLLSPWRRVAGAPSAAGMSWIAQAPAMARESSGSPVGSPITPPPLPAQSAHTSPAAPQSEARWPYAFASAAGWVVLLISLLISAAMAINMPGMVLLPAVWRSQQSDGPSSTLIQLTGAVVGSVGFFAALVLFLLGRRQRGALHLVRALVGVPLAAGSCALAYAAIRHPLSYMATAMATSGFSPVPTSLAVLSAYLHDVDSSMIIGAGFMLLGAFILLAWPPSARGNAARVGPVPWLFGSIAGWITLLASMLLALAMAIDVPGISMLNVEARSANWQGPPSLLFRVIGTFLAATGMYLALVLMMAGRRGRGIFHLLRAIIGVTGIAVACGVAYLGFESHHPLIGKEVMMPNSSPAQVLDAYVRDFDAGALAGAGFIVMVSLTFLIWPPRKPQAAAASTPPAPQVSPKAGEVLP